MIIDHYERLQAAMPNIIKFVNSFSSEQVQMRAYEDLIKTLGVLEVPVPPQEGGRHDAAATAADEDAAAPEDTSIDGSDTQSASKPTTRRKNRGGAKKNWSAARDINFWPDDGKSITDLVAKTQPRSQNEKNLVIVYYLQNELGMTGIDPNRVLAGYAACEWDKPAQPDVSLRKTASVEGWLDTRDTNNVTVTYKGRRMVEDQMPVARKAKK